MPDHGKPWRDFKSFPLMMGAIACFFGGIVIIESFNDEGTRAIGGALIVIGAVLVGSWIWALATADHSGIYRPPPDRSDDDTLD